METPIDHNIIEIDHRTLKNLNTTRKWTMFLAITGSIFLGLIIISGVVAGTFLSSFNSGKTGGISLPLMMALFAGPIIMLFLPIFFLFRFSKHTSNAILTFNKNELFKSIKYLKYFFTYIGFLIIIVLVSYIAVIIISGSTISILKNFG